MSSRAQLHEEFCEILGSRNVYFQPPNSAQMKYPCIVYSKAGVDTLSANNKKYVKHNIYDATLIEYDADSELYNDILDHFEMCSLGNCYTADKLYHKTFKLYY